MAEYNELEMFKLFDSMKYFVFCTGGDGDGWFVSDNYRCYADLFEKFEGMCSRPYFLYRNDYDGMVVFGHEEHSEDSIAFVKDRSAIYYSAYKDIVLEIK